MKKKKREKSRKFSCKFNCNSYFKVVRLWAEQENQRQIAKQERKIKEHRQSYIIYVFRLFTQQKSCLSQSLKLTDRKSKCRPKEHKTSKVRKERQENREYEKDKWFAEEPTHQKSKELPFVKEVLVIDKGILQHHIRRLYENFIRTGVSVPWSLEDYGETH